MNEHQHAAGFDHLDLEVDDLQHEFHLAWKLLPQSDGPPGYTGDPYIPMAVAFTMTGQGTRRSGHLDYSLDRSFWGHQIPAPASEQDGERLRRLVLERLPLDLRLLDQGIDPAALRIQSESPGKSLVP